MDTGTDTGTQHEYRDTNIMDTGAGNTELDVPRHGVRAVARGA